MTSIITFHSKGQYGMKHDTTAVVDKGKLIKYTSKARVVICLVFTLSTVKYAFQICKISEFRPIKPLFEKKNSNFFVVDK